MKLKNNRPLISVIIPSYNHDKYILKALGSVLAQTYSNFETIIVDDGSNDSSPKLIKKYLQDLDTNIASKIIFKTQKNQGAHAAINLGLKISSGEYIAILNSDDTFHPERLERLYLNLSRSSSQFAFSGVQFIDEQDRKINGSGEIPFFYHRALALRHYFKTLGLSLFRENISMSTSNFFMKRELVDQVGEFRSFKWVHDIDYLLRSLHFCEPLLVQDNLLSYRSHITNTIKTRDGRFFSESKQILSDYLNNVIFGKLPKNGLAPHPENWPHDFQYFLRDHYTFGSVHRNLIQIYSPLDRIQSSSEMATDFRKIAATLQIESSEILEKLQESPELFGTNPMWIQHKPGGLKDFTYRLKRHPRIWIEKSNQFRFGTFVQLSIKALDPQADLTGRNMAWVENGQIVATGNYKRSHRVQSETYRFWYKEKNKPFDPKKGYPIIYEFGPEFGYHLFAKPKHKTIRYSPESTLANKELFWQNKKYVFSQFNQGHVDSISIENSVVSAHCWSVNSAGNSGPLRILCFLNGKYTPAMSMERKSRPDLVGTILNVELSSVHNAGFMCTIHLKDVSRLAHQKLTIISIFADGTAFKLFEDSLKNIGKISPLLKAKKPYEVPYLRASIKNNKIQLKNSRSGANLRIPEISLKILEVKLGLHQAKRYWGFIESIYKKHNQQIQMSGWCLHPKSKKPPTAILIYCRGNAVLVEPQQMRNDIQLLHGLHQPLRCGFEVTLPQNSFQIDEIEVYGLWNYGIAVRLSKLISY